MRQKAEQLLKIFQKADAVKYVWVHIDTSKNVGDRDHVKIFADPDSAHAWFMVHDPEGIAFEYPVIEQQAGPTPLQPT